MIFFYDAYRIVSIFSVYNDAKKPHTNNIDVRLNPKNAYYEILFIKSY